MHFIVNLWCLFSSFVCLILSYIRFDVIFCKKRRKKINLELILGYIVLRLREIDKFCTIFSRKSYKNSLKTALCRCIYTQIGVNYYSNYNLRTFGLKIWKLVIITALRWNAKWVKFGINWVFSSYLKCFCYIRENTRTRATKFGENVQSHLYFKFMVSYLHYHNDNPLY